MTAAPFAPTARPPAIPGRDPPVPGMSSPEFVFTKPAERQRQMVRPFRAAADRPWLLPALLIAVSALSSCAFACSAPFAGLALTAAYALPMPAAVLTAAGIWGANQFVGLAVLGYPWDANALLWGVAIGVATVAATAVAGAILRVAARNQVVAVVTAFVMTFVALESCLFITAFALGGGEDFTLAIMGRVALLNFGCTVALIGTCEILRHIGLLSGQPMSSTNLLAAPTR
jgi:hypothetical protein